MRQAVAQVAACNRHDHAQMRHDHLARGVNIAFVAQTGGQFDFLLLAEHRHAIDAVDVLIQAAGGGNGK